jgi:hypothetical protein
MANQVMMLEFVLRTINMTTAAETLETVKILDSEIASRFEVLQYAR